MRTETSTWKERLIESTAQQIPGSKAERWTLLLLLLLALVLRFWGFPNIPYTHDEISALVRVDYPTLGEAIGKGVVGIDTHPPGTHAFLWCWTQLVGFGDGAVKAPFMLMSVLALFLLYRFAHAWAGVPVALITTALLACMQYTVMYGQIARPYAMGLFTTSLLADQITRYIGTGRRIHLVLITLAAVLSAYAHHFALLLAAFMMITGVVLLDRSRRKGFLIAAAIAVACYLPNLPLFFAQFGWKGLDEWLIAPSPDWVLKYAWWIGHCSMLFAGLFVLLMVTAFVLRIRHRNASMPVLLITLFWGLLPLVIGYAYSVFRSPVLQYSVVLFSFPYLLIGALAGLRHLKAIHGIVLALLSACVGTFTLVTERRHYEIFNRSKYEAIVMGTIEATDRGSLAVVDLPEEVMGFYRKLWGVKPSQVHYVNLCYQDRSVLDSVLTDTHATMIFYGQTTQGQPENVAMVQARFPFLQERHDFYEGQTFRFSASPTGEDITDISAPRSATPDGRDLHGWDVDAKIGVAVDSSGTGQPKAWDYTGHEYGAVYDGPVYELIGGSSDQIEVRADVAQADPQSDLELVVELKQGDSTRFYRYVPVAEAPRIGEVAALITVVKLADIPGHGEGLRLRTYLYNKSRRKVLIRRLSLQGRQGDPVLYGLFQPIKSEWRFR